VSVPPADPARPGGHIQPYLPEVPEAELEDLRQRLDRTRRPDELPALARGH
jgi:hypothetical protein